MDFFGFDKIGRVLDPDLFFTPSYNKRLTLTIVGIVFAVISSKTRLRGVMPLGMAKCATPMTSPMLGQDATSSWALSLVCQSRKEW